MLYKSLKYIYLLLVSLAVLYLNSCSEKELQWQQKNGYRSAQIPLSVGQKVGFSKLDSSATGINFINGVTDDQIISNQHLLDGSGVATGDIDNDGYCDIYFSRLNGSSVLYRNLGNWKFEDITSKAGVGLPDRYSKGATFADIDGDRDLDLLVTVLDGPNACFINDGKGVFKDVTEASGLSSLKDRTGNTSMALGDIDGDADLDLYMVSYKFKARRDRESPVLNESGLMLYEPDYGERDILYINDGKGVFSDVDLDSDVFMREDGEPVMMPRAWGLTARMQDMDNDGDPDIYVCNDFASADFIWMNEGSGRFKAIPMLAVRTTSASSMTVAFADINRDDHLDFFVADMLSRDHKRRKMQMGEMARTNITVGKIYNRPQVMRNTLFLNRGDGTYAEIGNYSGMYASDWTWSAIFMDVDLDGYEDLLTTTGHAYDVQDYDTQQKLINQKIRDIEKIKQSIFMYPRLETTNFAFQNNGNLAFTENGNGWGFDTEGISHGMALADLDNDGDLDVVTNNFESMAGVYKNQSTVSRIAVRLKGLSPNTYGIGAKISLHSEDMTLSKEVICGGQYLSGSEQIVVFAVPDKSKNMQIEVRWRSGMQSILSEVASNHIYEIDEAAAERFEENQEPQSEVYFKDVSDLIDHIHFDQAFNDFYRQPLLPNQLSQMGPGISWYDINNDQYDDLIITSGKGGKLAIYENQNGQKFKKISGSSSNRYAAEDQTTALVFEHTSGNLSMVLGMSNYEISSKLYPPAIPFRFKDRMLVSNNPLETELSSTGPMTLSDYDNDGDIDLFIGGRVVPGKYPDPASSKLYLNEGGQFVLDKINSRELSRIGLVSGSIFSDIDNDGDSDLILAVEWGPIMLFENVSGKFENATEKFGLSQTRGWWNGLTTGDLDEDGRLDIIATNWGLNSKYHYTPEHPLKIYYDDFDNNGTLDIVEAHYDSQRRSIVPERGFSCMSRAMPFIKGNITSFEQYGGSALQEIIGADLMGADSLLANTLAHSIFFNRGESFEVISLPDESQFSPAFYAGVADFDGDGHDDIFLSQNFFATQPETPRIDAGRGIWLKGDGNGNLISMPGQSSGIKIYGEQRGAALSDFNKDGKIDLAVSQNGAQTKLYENILAKAGLRVHLKGSENNPKAIGAVVRIIYENGMGPARQIHAGSGYWSQDSPVLVMGLKQEPTKIQVKWPGEKVTESDIPNGVRDITLDINGQVLKNN
jgi:hypothetical protein